MTASGRTPPSTHALRVADLSPARPRQFEIVPGADERAVLAEEMGLIALKKLSFAGEIRAHGKSDWLLEGQLGATVVQPCAVTLDPVTTRIDEKVTRLFQRDFADPDLPEAEMPEDETIEALGTFIDPSAVMVEALALALPLYPRAAGVDLGEAVFAAPGVTPMRDEDARPFAGLAGLRDALDDSDKDEK